MSNKEESGNKKNTSELKLNRAIREEQKKSIEDTYKLYSSEEISVKDTNSVIREKQVEEIKPQKENKEPAQLMQFDNVSMEKPKPVVKPNIKPVKPSTPEVSSIKSLNSNLQNGIKDVLNNKEDKLKVEQLLKEMKEEEETLFKGEKGVFGSVNKSEQSVISKKLKEMQVSNEVAEINFSAIISCLNNGKNK